MNPKLDNVLSHDVLVNDVHAMNIINHHPLRNMKE
jgi:hypothetical protein